MNIFKNFKIFKILLDLKPHKIPTLGRWALHHNKVAHMKADMTNEDHCGVCDKMRYDYIDKDTSNIKSTSNIKNK